MRQIIYSRRLLACLLSTVLLITLCSCGGNIFGKSPIASQDIETTQNDVRTSDIPDNGVSPDSSATSTPSPELDSISDVPPVIIETANSWDGTYYGLLDVGVWETLSINDYNDKSFSFSFVESGISGDAEFSDDGYAYYYDDAGHAINFKFENNEVLVDAGYRYISLAATYTRAKNVTTEGSDRDDDTQTESLYYEGYDKQEVEAFAKAIKDSILSDDKETFAELINYPIKVIIDEQETAIINSSEFIENYDKIVHTDFRIAISEAAVVDMFNNYMGVMIGSGLIWFGFAYEKDGLWVTAINNYL